MSQREIAGYYYDTAKRKYFLIEGNQTAPAQAAWSAQNVKRRAVEQQEDAARRERLRREARRVKRARILQAPLLGGLLTREAGEAGAGGMLATGDIVGRAWAAGLKPRGGVNMWPQQHSESTSGVSSMVMVSGDEPEMLGLAVAVANGGVMASSYFPSDGGDSINFRNAAERYPHLSFLPQHYSERAGGHTTIKFHEPTRRILLAYGRLRHRPNSISIRQFTCHFPDPGGPLGPSNHLSDAGLVSIEGASTIHVLQPAPAGSPLACIAGTDKGIVRLLHVGELSWLTPGPTVRQGSTKKVRTRFINPSENPSRWQGDVLSVDFLAANPAALILAGTRSSHICLFDLRTSPSTWSTRANTFRHASSVAHIRSVGDHGVLAAGPRSAMALYDMRFLPRPSTGGGSNSSNDHANNDHKKYNSNNWTRPLLTFPSYRNEAHIQIGLDVLTTPGCGSSAGVVAAAHDDETVALYSLADGARLCNPTAVDAIKAPGVVRSLQWHTLPGERHPSLFVGEGAWVKKYSFWA